MTLLFDGNYESGSAINQYMRMELTDSVQGTQLIYVGQTATGFQYIPEVATSPTRSPTSLFSGAYSVGGTQSRCESTPPYVQLVSPYAYLPICGQEGTNLYFGWSVYYPSDFPVATWQACGQWHQDTLDPGWGPNPPIAFYVAMTNQIGVGIIPDPTHWYLAYSGADVNAPGAWSIDCGVLVRGAWTDVTTHIIFSETAVNCLTEVWVNGVLKGSIVPPSQNLYPSAQYGANDYFKHGIYRDPAVTTPTTVYYDNVKIGTTYADVQPDAPGRGAANVSARQLMRGRLR